MVVIPFKNGNSSTLMKLRQLLSGFASRNSLQKRKFFNMNNLWEVQDAEYGRNSLQKRKFFNLWAFEDGNNILIGAS